MDFENWSVSDEDPEALALERHRARLEANLSIDFTNTARMLGNFRRALAREKLSAQLADWIVRDYYNELLDQARRDDDEDGD